MSAAGAQLSKYGMQVSRCHQDKKMLADNFNRNLHHFNMEKVEHFKLFHIKIKED